MKEAGTARPEGDLPHHVAIIMDGNGRWAERRNLPRIAGHKAGEDSVTDIVRAGSEWGLGAITLFAFSTENWNRPANEVEFLMSFNRNLLNRRVDEFHERGVRIRHMGRRDGIPRPTLEAIDNAVGLTGENAGMALNIAFNYGGRAEIIDAVRGLCGDIASGKVRPGEIDEEAFRSYLYVPEMPDPDLLIRTAGENRISNFLIWELAYTELYFTEVLWPDFRRGDLAEALEEFQSRERRYGSIREE